MAEAVTLAYYGDDFTGSTDTLATAVQAGWRAALFMHVPSRDELAAFGPLDCIGVAGTARTQSPAQMDAELPAIFRGLAATGAPFIQYKTCSTFDSAPHVGSIGHAMTLGRAAIDGGPAFIVGGQPSLGRYCCFATLFARAGQDGAIYRIDRHPTMSHHPITPMLEPDLRLHLAAQGLEDVQSFDVAHLEQDESARQGLLNTLIARRPPAVLFDATSAQHLARIGTLLRQHSIDTNKPLLLAGPTGVLQALAAAASRPTNRSEPAAPIRAVAQTFIVSGSRSPITAAQIRHAESVGFVSIAIDAAAMVAAPAANIDGLVAEIARALAAGHSVVAHSTFGDDSGGTQAGFTAALARGCGQLMAQVLARHRLVRVGFAGGDTSSMAVVAWGIQALTLAYSLSPGVAVCRVHADDATLNGVELMLKGGQMGAPDVFSALLGGSA